MIFAPLITAILGIFIYPTVLFGFHFPDMGFLAWVYLVPLLAYFEAEHSSFKKIFTITLIISTLFYLGCVYWFVLAMKNFGGLNFVQSTIVMSLIVLMMAGFLSLGTMAAFVFSRRLRLPLYVVFPVVLVVCDFLRTYFPFGGFPWTSPAYSQGKYLAYFQWIDLTGVSGLHYLIYFSNALLAVVARVFITAQKKEKLVTPLILFMLALCISFTLSIQRKSSFEDLHPKTGGRQIALIQGNIDQDMKWNPSLASKNLKKYIELTNTAAERGAELALWPETAYPFSVDLQNMADQRFVDSGSLPIPVLTGAVSIDKGEDPTSAEKLYNSAFLVGTDALIGSLNPLDGHFYYHKRHLVPFGEYIPLKNWLTFAKRLTVAVGDFTPGTDLSPVVWKDFKMGMLICYEDIFHEEAREAVLAGANILVNLTNDAWYGNTSAQYQHVVFSQIRALENRRYLLRATNTGVSAIIDSNGAVLSSLPVYREGILNQFAYPMETISVFTQYGSVLGFACIVAFFMMFVFSLLKNE